MSVHKIVLTGDRPTGPLHLGHYIGSLINRISLQADYKQYIMIADVQAFTDHFEHPEKVAHNVRQVALDYLAVGIDPKKTTIFIQSLIPEIAELTIFFMNFVTINRLQRNPTVKTEIQQKEYGSNVRAGFLLYPVSQTADICIVKGSVVPVGQDQLPMIEQANEIVRAFNRTYHTEVFPHIEATLSQVPRLVGTDGKAKMSKSLGNAIFLSDSADQIKKKVMSMYTDPNHIHVDDPGRVEGNVVFSYLDVFDPDKKEVNELKERYTKGGLGDVVIKKRLIDVLNAFLDPIRKKRKLYESQKGYVESVLKEGTNHARKVAQETMHEVRKAMHIDYKL